MISNSDLKRYQKKQGYSYSFGAFPTFELLTGQPGQAEKVFVHSGAKQEIRAKAEELCRQAGVPLMENDRLMERIREKDSCLVIGVFRKYTCELEHGENHVVLVNPGDGGNLGTILRTCVGFGIRNLAVIEPGVDIFDPKVVRASMGSLFHLNFCYFGDYGEYRREYGEEREQYPFMLKGAKKLGSFAAPKERPFSLVFGNEASGLEDRFLEVGQSVVIGHSGKIDSLNLSLAVGIGIYEFMKGNF